jgi:hypothetical protein
MESPDYLRLHNHDRDDGCEQTHVAFPVITRIFKRVSINYSLGSANSEDVLPELE